MGVTITTRDIAKASGYGQSTVSMALRNDPRLSESTRHLIQNTAHKLGYLPDAVFSRMMASVKRRRVERELQPLAFVLFWSSAEEFYHFKCYREYREGAQARALEFGYSLEDFVVHPQVLTPGRLIKILKTRAMPGVLIPPVYLPKDAPEFQGLDAPLDCEDHAFSTFGYSLATPCLNRVTHDHAGACEIAFSALTTRNYRKIGLVLSQAMHSRVQGRWMAGFFVAQHHLPAKERIPPLIIHNLNSNREFHTWFERYKPDVILAVELDDIMSYLDKAGIRCPQDIGIAHLDARSTDVPCAGIDQRNHAIGRVGFDLLLAQIMRNERGIPAERRTVHLEGTWVDGPTLRI